MFYTFFKKSLYYHINFNVQKSVTQNNKHSCLCNYLKMNIFKVKVFSFKTRLTHSEACLILLDSPSSFSYTNFTFSKRRLKNTNKISIRRFFLNKNKRFTELLNVRIMPDFCDD